MSFPATGIHNRSGVFLRYIQLCMPDDEAYDVQGKPHYVLNKVDDKVFIMLATKRSGVMSI